MQRRPLKLKLAGIRAMAAFRPPGYYEDVVASGEISGEYLLLSPREFSRLRTKYLEPAKDWPIWTLVVALFAGAEDRGIGDTIQREIGRPKTEPFKRWHEATFGLWTPPCGCGEIARWNTLYPYALKLYA